MLWRVGVGAHQEKAPIGEMGARGPHLLPIDDEMITQVYGTGTQAGEIAAGIGLRIALAPQLVSTEDARQMTLLLLFGSPMDESWAQ